MEQCLLYEKLENTNENWCVTAISISDYCRCFATHILQEAARKMISFQSSVSNAITWGAQVMAFTVAQHTELPCSAVFLYRPVFFHLDSNMPDLVTPFTPARGPSPSLPLLVDSMKCCLQLPRMKPKWKSSAKKRRPSKEGKQWRFGGNLKAALTWRGIDQCPARRSFPKGP